MGVDLTLVIDFHSHEAELVAYCQVGVFVEVLVLVPVLLEGDPVLALLLGRLLFLLDLGVQGYLRGILLAYFYQFGHDLVIGEWQ